MRAIEQQNLTLNSSPFNGISIFLPRFFENTIVRYIVMCHLERLLAFLSQFGTLERES